MAVTRETFRVPSGDGVHSLFCVLYRPAGQPIGLFQLVHGMTEYIDRYAPLMEAAAEAGLVCFGHNHLGHKDTAGDDELGYIAEKGGDRLLVADVHAVGEEMRRAYPGLPHVLFGHSMGSFVARLAAERYGEEYASCVFCGSGSAPAGALLGQGVLRALATLRGDHAVSGLAYRLAFGGYRRRCKDEPSPNAWVTSDPEQLARYDSDPYCTFRFTLSAMGDLVRLNRRANRGAWFAHMRRDLPILMVSGDDDPVGGWGKGVTRVAERLRNAGCTVELKLYPGMRHEILNERGREEPTRDILDFVLRHVRVEKAERA